MTPARSSARARAQVPLLLIAPVVLPMLLLFAALAGILLQSVVRQDGSLSLQTYASFLGDSYYLDALMRSLAMAVVCALGCLVLGVPVAYVMSRGGSRVASIVTLALAAQFFSIYVIKMYGWVLVLGNNGIINRPLLALGWIERPLPLINTPLGVAIGLVGSALPLMVFPISAVMQSMNRRLEEAAASLGAGPWCTLWTVTLPLAAPGVIGGTVLVFVFCFTAFLTPALLGGGRFRMIGNIIYDEAIFKFNYPTAATAAAITLAVSLVVIVSLGALSQRLAVRRAP